MKNNNTILEQSLSMYKETVSPGQDHLKEILSQIPEQQTKELPRAIRSPYTWVVITQAVTLGMIVLFVYPTLSSLDASSDYYAIDRQIEAFDIKLDNSDYENMVIDYSNYNL